MSALAALLSAALEEFGLPFTPAQQDKLLVYLRLLAKWNKVYNLTAIHEPERMLTHHILDSLAILPYVQADRLLDVGSGGGLPGIPLAVAMPDLQVTLMDSNGKKCAFMQQAVIELGLYNVKVAHARAEDYQPEACFDQIVSRAFSDLGDFVRVSRHLLCPEGEWLAMKGVYPQDELARLADARVKADIKLSVPGLGADRHLIIMEPIAMTRILAITNQKGGVGKTTTAVNLAAGLASLEQRVLLIDLDPQGNATMGSGINKRDCRQTVYHVLIGQAEGASVRVRSGGSGYDLLPANRDLAGAEVELVEADNREYRLKTALAAIAHDYDYILIDCPPALNLLTVNALAASDAILIPMQCEYFALEGLSDLVNTVKKVKARLNPGIEIEGLLRAMYDPRNTLAQQVSEQLKGHFGNKVYDTVIPRNVRLAEAPSYGQSGLAYDRASKGAQAYLQLAREIVARQQARKEM
jgi:chromosome partitioning protein